MQEKRHTYFYIDKLLEPVKKFKRLPDKNSASKIQHILIPVITHWKKKKMRATKIKHSDFNLTRNTQEILKV